MRAPGAERGIAGHLAPLVDGHQHRVTLIVALGQPGAAVVEVDDPVVPDCRAVLYRVVVDPQDACEVGVQGVAYLHVEFLQKRFKVVRSRH
jgi:hypothetical protein